jgi:hypothetical protein
MCNEFVFMNDKCDLGLHEKLALSELILNSK